MTLESRRSALGAGLCAVALAGVFGLGALFDPHARPDRQDPQLLARRQGRIGPEGLPNYLVDPPGAGRRVDEIARRSGGDFSRLTPMEQRWLNAMAAGHGARLLRARAREAAGSPAARETGANRGRTPDQGADVQ